MSIIPWKPVWLLLFLPSLSQISTINYLIWWVDLTNGTDCQTLKNTVTPQKTTTSIIGLSYCMWLVGHMALWGLSAHSFPHLYLFTLVLFRFSLASYVHVRLHPLAASILLTAMLKNKVSYYPKQALCNMHIFCTSRALEKQLNWFQKVFKSSIHNTMHVAALDNNQCLRFQFGAIVAVSQNLLITLYTSFYSSLPPSFVLSSVFFMSSISILKALVAWPARLMVWPGIRTGEWAAINRLD